MHKTAHQFADWCHRVGEMNPTRLTFRVWLNYNPNVWPETVLWDTFVHLWTTFRRIA